MQCPFIKAEMEKLLKIVETVDKNSPLKGEGSNNNCSCLNLIFFHVFEQKVLMSEFCFSFSFSYCYYWLLVIGTANINFVLTMKRKTPTQYQPPFPPRIMLGGTSITVKF